MMRGRMGMPGGYIDLSEVAMVLFAYREALVHEGFSEEEALEIVIAMQNLIIGG